MPKHHYVIRRLIYDPKITVMETAWHRLALQGGIRAAERMHGRFDNFIAVHILSFPFECMAAVLLRVRIGRIDGPYVIERIGADKLLYSSDYPHWDISWPKTVRMFQESQDISDDEKQQIAWENPQKFYGFEAES